MECDHRVALLNGRHYIHHSSGNPTIAHFLAQLVCVVLHSSLGTEQHVINRSELSYQLEEVLQPRLWWVNLPQAMHEFRH
ncbi:Uncharacterised protein [Acinetobacter baumannii]|nr:Uncharacterised protein [Acinetobacter baumannii]